MKESCDKILVRSLGPRSCADPGDVLGVATAGLRPRSETESWKVPLLLRRRSRASVGRSLAAKMTAVRLSVVGFS